MKSEALQCPTKMQTDVPNFMIMVQRDATRYHEPGTVFRIQGDQIWVVQECVPVSWKEKRKRGNRPAVPFWNIRLQWLSPEEEIIYEVMGS